MLIRIERLAAFLALIGYCGWNAFWLARWQVPQSVFVAATGFPCPTTGGCRSVIALANADFVGSLYWNPMTVPIAAMLTGTAVFMVRDLVAARKPAFGTVYARGWILILVLGWAFKIAVSLREKAT